MSADLFCCERLQPDLAKAEFDPVIFSDVRALKHLILREKELTTKDNYFETTQTEVKPFMRQIVTTWMLEVCEELVCEDQVFPVAVNLLDRFLTCCKISKRELQLLASVCLLVASKIRQSQLISVKTLCYYTENSITSDDVRDWELLLMSKLGWNLNGVTAYDYLEHLFDKLSWAQGHILLRRHAVSLVSVCCTDSDLIQISPSVIATACICSAARGLRISGSCNVLEEISNLLPNVTASRVQPVIDRIEDAVASSVQPSEEMTPSEKHSCDSFPETPTDVDDIYF